MLQNIVGGIDISEFSKRFDKGHTRKQRNNI